MRTLTIVKNKPQSKERNELCQTALKAVKQTVVVDTEHGTASFECVWDVRQK
jgi:hypothetical protein